MPTIRQCWNLSFGQYHARREKGQMTEQTAPVWTGQQGVYQWLISGCSLGDVLSICPAIVVGKFVAVTAFDSGPLVPTEDERKKGWSSQFGIAYSPRIVDTEAIPYDNCFDEWYVFDQHTEVGRIADQGSNVFEEWRSEDTIFRFVNYWLDLRRDDKKLLTDLFWKQINRIRPGVYVADCQLFSTVVSKDQQLFEAVREGMAKLRASE
jgi:hypothetical protein